jgi:membrane protein DedA with SNARE-associated domain
MPDTYLFHSFLIGGSFLLFNLGNKIGDLFAGYGGLAVLLLAVGDSSFISVPEGNDLLIIVLSTGGSWRNMVFFVSMTVIGSVIGCFLLYSVGRKGGRAILKKKFSIQKIERAEKIYGKYGTWAVLIPSILPPPLPFKIFVLSAGVFGLPSLKFLSAVAIGRSVRYSLWGILAVLYGNSFRLFLENNLNTLGKGLLIIFILSAAGAVVFYIRRKKTPGKIEASPDDSGQIM